MIKQLKDTFEDIWTYHNFKAESREEAINFLNSLKDVKSKEIYYVETDKEEFWI